MKWLIGFNAFLKKGLFHLLFLKFVIGVFGPENLSQLLSIVVACDLVSIHTVVEEAAFIFVRLCSTILILIAE